MWSVLVPGGLACSGGGVCGGVCWSQLLFCCGSSGGFMLCLASAMDHFWCTEPVSNLVLRHMLHTCISFQQPWKAHVSHKFAHPHFTPGSNGNSSLSTKKVHTYTNFSKLFLNSFSEKVLALNFFSSPLYHPPSLPAVYFLSPLSRGLSNAFPLPVSFSLFAKNSTTTMILARYAGGVTWWFHCWACACLRCLSGTAVVPLSLSGAPL